MISCCRYFKAWQEELDDAPAFWAIRHLPTNEWWRNKLAHEWTGGAKVIGWDDLLRWVHHEDIHRLEDAHSLALKTGKPQRVELRVRSQAHRLNCIAHIVAATHCKGCGKACALIISRTEVSWEEEATPSSEQADPRTA